jgi:hypothetical protein
MQAKQYFLTVHELHHFNPKGTQCPTIALLEKLKFTCSKQKSK